MSQVATRARRLGATIATALACYVLARASDAHLPLHDPRSGVLRLSWSARPERIERCRVLSPDELEQLGEHMRQRIRCDGRFASYTLRVDVDDRVLDEAIVRGAGLRNDRPIYLLRDFRIPEGRHRLRVRLERRERIDSTARRPENEDRDEERHDTGTFAGRGRRENVERDRRIRAAIPPLLTLDTTVTVAGGHVVLVTMDPDRRALRLIQERSP